MGSYSIRTLLLSAFLSLICIGTAAGAGVSGRLLLGAYKPPAPAPKRAAYNWELENGFKEVLPDRIDAARELAVVLTGSGDAAGLDRTEVVFNGGSLLPETIIARTGATLLVRNEDEIAHEVYAEALDKFAAEAISPRGRRTVKLDAAGNWPLHDRLIPHVKGHLHVIDDLIAIGVIDASGRYNFEDVAPGMYTLKVFHGPKQIGSAQVEVASKSVTIDPLALTAETAEPAETTEAEPAEEAK